MTWKTTDTKLRLLEAARREFLKYGFAEASLRRVAAEVGIAAPSVYNHFSGKEEMFSALVEPVIGKILATFQATNERKRDALSQKDTGDAFDKDRIMNTVLDFVFENLEDVRLLLFCARGTKYEDILDSAARMEADATLRMMAEAYYSPPDVDTETIFLLMRHQYQAYAEAIRLDYSKEKTAAYWQSVRKFYDAGWRQLWP